MDKAKFFNALRASPVLFGKSLSSGEVKGTEAIVDTAMEYGVSYIHFVSNMLAEVYHETGGQMMPVKETVYASSTNRNPSDATVIARLDAAFAKGQLPWVKTPYWRDGWFGRGQLQVTHEPNYKKLGDAIGVDLVANRDLALDLKYSSQIVVVGMTKGLFTGKKLSNYSFPSALDAAPKDNPRRIINGVDGTDKDVAKYHLEFYNALFLADYGTITQINPPSPSPVIPDPVLPEKPSKRTRGVIIAEVQALMEELKSLGD